ncbi:unnamed protein product [Ranitomeya imitator]|uniref:Uncharacterized protein n=1 Tax=Ranitomeya imitator TaxID=111125 RepID=A0ABN9LVJ8_9NEOB|nr:unnamed protein product [Ranitomeya imitator]
MADVSVCAHQVTNIEKTTWIDIRGNHDSFNIADLSSSNNYYRKYSGWQKEGSFHYVHQTPFGNYSFICVDATLTPGPKRPYNFFGIVNQNTFPNCGQSLKAEVANAGTHTSRLMYWNYGCQRMLAQNAIFLSRRNMSNSEVDRYPCQEDGDRNHAHRTRLRILAYSTGEIKKGDQPPLQSGRLPSPSTMSAQQEPSNTRDESTPIPPKWAVATSVGLRPDKSFTFPGPGPGATSTFVYCHQFSEASHGDSHAPYRDLHRVGTKQRKRALSSPPSSSPDPSASSWMHSSPYAPSSEVAFGLDVDSQSESDTDQNSMMQDMVKSLILAIAQVLNLKEDGVTAQEHSVSFKRTSFINVQNLLMWIRRFLLSSRTVLSLLDGESAKDSTDRLNPWLSQPLKQLSPPSVPFLPPPGCRKKAKAPKRALGTVAPQSSSVHSGQIVHAGKYLLTASSDAAGSARATSNIVAIRRILCLKAWNADPQSNKSLTGLAFQGSRLFGFKLDQIISNATAAKNTSLPQSQSKV